jgi:hypothetical protein
MRKFLSFAVLLFMMLGNTAFMPKVSDANVSPCSINESINLDFVLVNKTGYTIENVYVAPSKDRDWGEDIMGKEYLEDGESVEISFDANEKVKKWDMYVTWEGYEADEDRYWLDFDLSEISKITLFYNAKTGKTWAETK